MDEPVPEVPVPPSASTPDGSISSPPRVSLAPIYGTLLLIAGILVGVGGMFAYQSYTYRKPVTSFDECVKANGNQTTAMFPATCTTQDGRTFTQPITAEEQQNITPPKALKTFTNEFFGLTLQYPDIMELYGSQDGESIRLSSFIPPCDIERGGTIICLVLPKPKDPVGGAGFESAGFHMGVKPNLSRQTCTTFADIGRTSGGSREINGVTYQTAVVTGAATGHEQVDMLYRTYRVSSCLEVTIRYTGETGALRAYTQTDTATSSMFDAILSSIAFADAAPTPTKLSNTQTLPYSLPSGWETITDTANTLEAGFDPRTMSASASQEGGMAIYSPAPVFYANRVLTVTTRAYDGGSRHAFILEPAGTVKEDERRPGYHENEYIVDGRKCLFLIGLAISQSPPIWGMCPKSGTEAYFMTSYAKTDTELEALLKTIQWL